MGLYDSALAHAADTQDVQAGGNGFMDNLGDAFTAGAAGAVVSGMGSIYNTFASGVNALGGDMDQVDTYKKLSEIDTNWANYYKNNQNAIDTVGFIGTSLIPGTIAIYGLNAVRAGNAANTFGRALGFFQTKQEYYLGEALKELAAEGGTIFTQINKNKLAAMTFGVADQVLSMAAFETGVALTMKQSPLLADDSWWNIAKSALVNAGVGGIIGGGIDSIILQKSFNNAVKTIDAKQRSYDYMQVLDKFKLSAGDKAYSIADSLLQLPDEVLESDKLLNLPFRIAKGTVTKEVDITNLLAGARTTTERTGMLNFETAVRSIAATDDEAAGGLANYIINTFKDMKTKGADPEAIKDALGDKLQNLTGVYPVSAIKQPEAQNLWYFAKKIDLDSIKTVDDWENAFKSTVPFKDTAYSKPFIFTGTQDDMFQAFTNRAAIGTEDGYETLKDAWKAGHDVAQLPGGEFRINPNSPLWKRVDDPIYANTQYLNTRTGSLTGDTVLTAADRLPVGKTLAGTMKADAVYLPVQEGKNITTKVIDMKTFNPDGDTEYFTARHAWASQLEDQQLIGRKIDTTDFSLMDRLRTVPSNILETITIKSGDRVLGKASDLNLAGVIKSSKLSTAQGMFADAYDAGTTLDVREVGYRLNVQPQWIENSVASRFADSLAGQVNIGGKIIDNVDGVTRDLSEYMHRENLVADFSTPLQFSALDSLSESMTWQQKRNAIMDQVAQNGGSFVTGELAYQYRVMAAVAANKNAAVAVLGADRASKLLDLAQSAAKLADSIGAGAKFLSSSNADYGDTVRLWAQTTGKLTRLWIEQDVSAVIDALSTVSNKLRKDLAAAAELGILTNILRGTEDKYVWDTAPKRMILRELAGKTGDALDDAIMGATSDGRRAIIDIDSDLVNEFLKIHTGLNADRINKRTVLITAKGMTSNIDPSTIYVPPIDTTYFKHFAFVLPKDGKAFGTSEVSMVFGRDANELSQRIATVDKTIYDVVTKNDTELYYKAKDKYDFDQTINEPRINSELKKTGALSNLFPEVRPENLLEDYIRWHQNQTARLVRDAVETNYAQQIEELNKLGDAYVSMATSKFSGTLSSSKSEIFNPYKDFVKTALDISKRSEYSFFNQANEFVDAVGTRAYQFLQDAFGDARKGMITWEEANKIGERYGIKGLYNGDQDFLTANTPRDRNLVREYVAKANSILANTVLRFDFANSILNTISTPVLLGSEMASIRNLIKNDPDLLGKLAELTTVAVPGKEGLVIPSNSKLIFNGVRNFFGPDKEELLARYIANNDIKTVLSRYSNAMDDLAMRADFKPFKEGVDRAFEAVADLTGNNWAEQFTRFVSADVMRQLTEPLIEAGKLSLKEQNAYISVFVNRVQGNYVSSQRPIAFQGVLGSAIGLFQTYTFNLLQQLLRHVENGDTRAAATMFGMQAGLFGLNGTPLFEAINTHILGNASINQGHYDAYSVAPAILGKSMGDWLLYGTASAFPAFSGNWPALYTRGDINPRNLTILPLLPQNIPAIDASIRVVSNLMDMGTKLIHGANVGPTLLQGLEHNGLNRPLAGFAQVLSKQSTTSQGSLISAANDFSLVATASRIAGAKPLDESIALNAKFRSDAYKAANMERTEQLGERVKTFLYNNQMPPDEVMDGFVKDYASAGGRVEDFNRTLQNWARDANESTVEKLRSKLTSSLGQRQNEIMGGIPLPDYRNQTPQSDIPPAS